MTDEVARGAEIVIEPVTDKRGRAAFVDLGRAFSDRLEHFVPQIRSEQIELVDPAKNPFFGHARAQLFIAKQGDKPVGRISAHIDELALAMPADQGFGPGTGFFGYFDAEDEDVARALLDEVLPLAQPVRLVGLTLSALEEDEPAPPPSGPATQGQLPF